MAQPVSSRSTASAFTPKRSQARSEYRHSPVRRAANVLDDQAWRTKPIRAASQAIGGRDRG